MFSLTPSLQTIPPYDFSRVNSSQAISFQSCPQLKVGVVKDHISTISYQSCDLSPSALNDIFTNLGLTGSGKTITIGGNWGASGCNRSIATAKGWAVSG
jgi:hypothetical protein